MQLHEERWSSSTELPSRQLRGFQDVLDRTHFHWGLKAGNDEGFVAKVLRRTVGEYVFTDIVADPVTGFRGKDDVKRGSQEYFCLLFFDAGTCSLRQGGHESIVRRDTIAIWDSTRPAQFSNNEQISQLSILLPSRDSKIIVPEIEDLCGLTVDGTTGLGSILLSHLRRIHSTIDSVLPENRPALMHATIELVAAAFKPQRDIVESTAFRRALVAQVQDYILANVGDPRLSPASVAASFRFSPRYLHRLFENSGMSVGVWIRKRRLLAARTTLTSPSSNPLNVTQIAMRHGFADASHFSHAFKKEFGLSPRDFRDAFREKSPP